MTPITREEMYLYALAGGSITPPSPVSRKEMYLAKACGQSVTVPTPVSREEMYLYKLSGGTITLPSPVSRLDLLMAAACGESVTPYTPVSRIEWFWAQIVVAMSTNLFDPDNANVISCYLTNTARVQWGSNVSSVWILCDPNTTYTVYRILGERFGIVWTIEQPASGVQGYGYISGATRDRLTITTGATAKYLFVYYYNGSYDTHTEQQIRDSMIIVKGRVLPPI